MTTQVSFITDIDLKRKALEKAKQAGITLKAVLVSAMKGFVEDKITFGLEMTKDEPEVEEIFFTDPGINKKALKLAQLLK